jgi:hypothetical protein
MYDQEWELDEFVGFLRAVRDGRELPWPAYECSLIYMTLGKPDAQGVLQLTPAGRALLAMLEIEHAKRRIEATGVFAWTDNMSAEYEHSCPILVSGVGPLGYQMPVSFGKRCGRSTVADWRAAAEYAEAHSQGVPE